MKTKKSTNKHNGKMSLEGILARAASAKKIAKAARAHLQAVKIEHKQARKAFKQAKRAARRARKEAKIAASAANDKKPKITARAKPKKVIAKVKAAPTRSALSKSAARVRQVKVTPDLLPMAALTPTAVNTANAAV
jgi:hypothetical protein